MEPKSTELQPLIKFFSFCDIDEPADRMREFRWNMVHRQLEGGAFEGELIAAQLAGIQFARVAYNREIRSWGGSPDGMIALAVPLSSPQLLTWHGHVISMDHVILQKGSQGVDFLRKGTFHHALAAIDIAALLQAADVTHQPQVESLLLGNALTAQPDETALNRFRRYFQTLFALIQMHPEQALRPTTQAFIRKKAIALMLNLLTPSGVSTFRSSSRYQVMKQAEAMMLENLDRPLTIHDLCMELHVSERTLRYGFQECFGMNPIAYLRAHRLNGVRRQLKTVAVAQTTVTDIAIQWGFWHMGQFAKDYKKMFDESPSETLRCFDVRARA
jgi:AraC family ethanolamine operon transcriptional activator